MESKYYTPSIEEFHVGFEYEKHDERTATYKEENYVPTNWHKFIYDSKAIRLSQLPTHLYSKTIRVKRLDSADIESFGFKNCGKHFSLPYNDPRKYDDVIHLIYQPITDWVLVCQGGFEDTFEDFKTRFSGYIKNKSELSKLLKQLAII